MDKQILEAAQKNIRTNSEKSPSETSTKTGLPLSWISALFAKLQARYGSKWTAAMEGIEDVAVTEWSQGLAGITGEQLKKGLEKLDSEWPPSLPEFRSICDGKKAIKPPELKPFKYDRTIESDEIKNKRKKAAKKGIAAMRKALDK